MTVTLTLDRRLDYRMIPALTDALRAITGQNVILDAAQTVQIGAQAVQILLAAAKSCLGNNATLKLANVTDAARAQLALLGLRIIDIEAGGDAELRAWA